jgi:hypothetical protein
MGMRRRTGLRGSREGPATLIAEVNGRDKVERFMIMEDDVK